MPNQQTPTQLQPAGHGGGDPGVVASVRSEAERVHPAGEDQRSRVRSRRGSGGASRAGTARHPGDEGARAQPGCRSLESEGSERRALSGARRAALSVNPLRLPVTNRNGDVLTLALGRDVPRVERRDRVVRHLAVRLGTLAADAALEEVLDLAVEALLPFLVRGRMAPAFLGPDLLHHVDVPELPRLRVVGVEQ